ncbi:hypothetical protein BOX15_Mlig004480g6, partial [Macrostomum lignano]
DFTNLATDQDVVKNNSGMPCLTAGLPSKNCPLGTYHNKGATDNCDKCPTWQQCIGEHKFWRAQCEQEIIRAGCQEFWNQSRDAETASSAHNFNSSAKLPGNASDVNTGAACDCKCNCPSDSWRRRNASSLIGKSVTEAPNLAENAPGSSSDIGGVAVSNNSSSAESLQPNTTEGSKNGAACQDSRVDPWTIVLAVLLFISLIAIAVLSCVIYKLCKNARTAVESSADKQCKFIKGENSFSQLLTKDEQTAGPTDTDGADKESLSK